MKNPFTPTGFTKAVQQLIIFSLLLLFCNNTYAGAKTWTGAASTDWGTASNWNPASVPSSKDDITIPVKANMPVFSTGTTTVHSLVIQTGASLTQTGGTLSVIGASMQTFGTFNQGGGSLYVDHDFKIQNNGVFNQSGSALLHMAKNGTTNPSANLIIASSATINQSGGTIYTKDYKASPGRFNQTGSTALFKVFHDWNPGVNSNFNSTNGTVQFTGTGGGGPNFAAGTRQFTNIIVDAGVDPKFDIDKNSKINISGDFTNNNTSLNNSTQATFTFNGTSPQNIYSASTGSNATFGNLIINKPSGSAVLTSNANVAGKINVQSGTYDLGAYTSNRTTGTSTLLVSAGATLRLGSNTGGQTGSNFPLRLTAILNKTSTVEYYGSGQTIYATPTYGNLTVSAAGAKTATAALNIANNFTLSTGTFVAGSFTHNVGGNWTMNSGTFTNTGSTINFNGTGPQRIASTGAFNKMTINKASGTTNITTDVTVNTTLTFTKGVVATSTNKMILPSGGSVVGAGQSTGWVNGNLQKYFASTAGGTFEVGGSLYYSPLTETFSGSFTAGSMIAGVKAGYHPNITGSTMASKNIGVYWSLSAPTTGALSFNKTDLDLTWNSADNYTGMIPASLKVANYAASAWSYPGLSGTPTTTTITAKNMTTLGDFAVGETSACTISSGFSYPSAEVCSNDGAAAVALNAGATSGVFTATPAGLSINAATGTITPGSSTPGTYTITNTVTGVCISTSNTTIKITGAPVATISYGNLPFCQSIGTTNVTITGAAGGTFSSTYGLVIDDVTGQVDLDDSDPGTYTVTYAVNSVSGCSAYIATANITVTVSSYANIAYSADAYCMNGGIAAVDFEGSTGGTFSSGAGLTLNSATGDITLASSTPGTYTVTYSGNAVNGCAAYSGTATITITSVSPGTISYAGSPYCASGIASATITGQAGGLFSSTTGLEIDDISGDINLDSSIAGTYIVTYSFGGCYSTTSVTVNPRATISYPPSSVCTAIGSYSVTLNGTAGGTYSSTAGLSLNGATGAVNAVLSTVGFYNVTYTLPVAGACPSYQVTTTTSIGIGSNGTWTGAVSTAWEDPGNWQCNILPVSTTNVTIPASLFNYPVISAITPEIRNLTLGSGSSVTVMNGTFKINGTFSNSGGNINATAGKIELTGTAAQTVPGSLFYSNTVKDLVITNAAGVTLAGAVRITGSVGFGNVNNSILTTGGFLTLVSTSSSTANVLDITNAGANSGNNISGLVTVERYVQGKRSYRFLTAPVNSITSIRANWMENTNNTSTGVNNNPVPNYGTHITGVGGSSNGFDVTSTNNPSIFTFNTAGQAWSAVPNTSGVFTAGNGYRMMIRGSRSVDLNNNYAVPSTTTLRATGNLLTGTVTMTTAGGGGTTGMPSLSTVNGAYTLVANPYASVVNWLLINKTDISSTIYVYDPTVSGSNGRGAYVAYNGILNVNNVVSSLISNQIQSGQAFFVQTTGANPSLTFKETYKSSTFSPVFRSAANEVANLSVELLLPSTAESTAAADEARVFFSDQLSASVGDEDSYKFTNQDENIGVVRNGKILSIEGRNPVTGSDTVELKIWQLSQKSYTLKVGFQNFPSNIEGYLEDAYLHTATPLNANSETLVPFSITSDTASISPGRFRIVFETLATLPVRLTGIKAYEKSKGVQVDWVAESENNMYSYEVQRSSDAQQFETIGSVKAKNNPGIAATYEFFDVSPVAGDNYYRIKSVEKSGDVKLSEVARVQIANEKNTITVMNNPVHRSPIKLLFDNVEKGSYRVSLISASGEKVYSGKISYAGGIERQQLEMPAGLAAGVYNLYLTHGNSNKNITVLIQ